MNLIASPGWRVSYQEAASANSTTASGERPTGFTVWAGDPTPACAPLPRRHQGLRPALPVRGGQFPRTILRHCALVPVPPVGGYRVIRQLIPHAVDPAAATHL